MKFCPVVPEICRGQVHGPRKERRRKRRKRRIIIRNGAKTLRLNKKQSKNNKSPKRCLGDLINKLYYSILIGQHILYLFKDFFNPHILLEFYMPT